MERVAKKWDAAGPSASLTPSERSHRGRFQLWAEINVLANDTDRSLTVITVDNILSHNRDPASCVREVSQIKEERANPHA